MTDYFLNVVPQSLEWELRSNVRRFSSPDGGVTRTHERVGSRWAATFSWETLIPDDAARLRAFLASQRGGGNRFWVTDPSYSQRGSFSAPELFTNSDFSNGVTGWNQTNATLSAPDKEMRILATTPTANVQVNQSVSLTQYAPHAIRSVLIDGPQTAGLSIGRFIDGGGAGQPAGADYGTSRGLGTLALTAGSGTAANQYPAVFNSATGFTAGAYITVPYTSLARCAVVDGGPNLLQRSDEFDNAYWTKSNSTVTANVGTAAPDGTTTADAIVENAATSAHYVQSTAVTVSSSAANYAFSVALRANSRTWAFLQLQEATGSTSAVAFVNLSTGAIGTTSVGANWSSVRAFVTSLGNSWYRVTIVARKTNAATSITATIGAATADNTSSYTGTNALVAVLAWRATLASGGLPTRLVQTTSAASGGTSQTGGGIYLKGLPVSTSGLLLAGDWAEIVTPTYSELKRVIAPLDSDASGLGFLQFEPILRQSPANDAAVIIRKPMCRMLLDESTVRTSHRPGGFMSCSFTAVEDIAA